MLVERRLIDGLLSFRGWKGIVCRMTLRRFRRREWL